MTNDDAGMSDDDFQWILDFLSEEPPYAAIGKVIHAGADLEAGILSLCRQYGLPHQKAWGKSVKDRVEWLRANADLDASLLDRVLPATERRNLLAHGTWIHAKDQRGFVKHTKEDAHNLHGQIATEETLEEWRAELQDLADYMTSRDLMLRGTPSDDDWT